MYVLIMYTMCLRIHVEAYILLYECDRDTLEIKNLSIFGQEKLPLVKDVRLMHDNPERLRDKKDLDVDDENMRYHSEPMILTLSLSPQNLTIIHHKFTSWWNQTANNVQNKVKFENFANSESSHTETDLQHILFEVDFLPLKICMFTSLNLEPLELRVRIFD